MKTVGLDELVSKAIGPITPTFEHSVDMARLENIKAHGELAGDMVARMAVIVHADSGATEASAKALVDEARRWLEGISESIKWALDKGPNDVAIFIKQEARGAGAEVQGRRLGHLPAYAAEL